MLEIDGDFTMGIFSEDVLLELLRKSFYAGDKVKKARIDWCLKALLNQR